MNRTTQPDKAPCDFIRITFELDPQQTAVDLWHTHIPVVGEKVLLANSEWTVIKADHEVMEFRGQFHTITRYVLGDERPAMKPAG